MASSFVDFFDNKVVGLAPNATQYRSPVLDTKGEPIIQKSDLESAIKKA